MISPAIYAVAGLAAIVIGVAVVLNVGEGAGDKPAHAVSGQGWVTVDPRTLALSAGVSDNTYALASMMQSEAGDNMALQLACGWCAKNQARRVGVSLFHLLVRAGKNDKTSHQFIPHASNGFYGPQNVGPRYASTRMSPKAAALSLAADILSDSVDDPTDGATKFDNPGKQDTFLGKVEGYLSSAADVTASRSKSMDLVTLPGITSTRFWRPKDA